MSGQVNDKVTSIPSRRAHIFSSWVSVFPFPFTLSLSISSTLLIPLECRLLLGSPGLGLGLHVEVDEEDNQGAVVAQLDVGPGAHGELGLTHGEDDDGLEDTGEELEDLELRQVLLQGVVDAVRSHEVVRVHQGVDHGVDPGTVECDAVADSVVEQETPDGADGQMVVDVQEGDLLVLVAEDHPDGVEHVQVLGHVVEEHLQLDGGSELTGDVEDGVAGDQVGGQHDGHESGQEDLQRIVEGHDARQLEGGPSLHEEVEASDDHD
eukprot:253090_1